MDILARTVRLPALGNGQTVRQNLDGSTLESYNPNAIAWLPLTLAAGWTVPAGFAAPQYRLLPGGRVALKGACSRTTSLLANGLITTLPTGFRPLEQRGFTLSAAGSTIVNVTVRPSGEVVYAGSSTLTNGVSQVSLEIEFDAEQ